MRTMSYLEGQDIKPGDVIRAEVYKLQGRIEVTVTGNPFTNEQGDECMRVAREGHKEGRAIPVAVLRGGYYFAGDTLVRFLPADMPQDRVERRASSWRRMVEDVRRRLGRSGI